MNATAELRSYLGTFAARCREARWYGALFHVGVVDDIAADAERVEQAAAKLARKAEAQVAQVAERVKNLRGIPAADRRAILGLVSAARAAAARASSILGCALVALGFSAAVHAAFSGDSQVRRPSLSYRTVRVVRLTGRTFRTRET